MEGTNSISVLETIVDICGIMGFALSVCMAVHQVVAKRRRIAVREVCIYEQRPAEKPFTAVRLSICNLSEAPVSIVGIRVRSGKRYVRAYQPRIKIASLTNHSTGKTQEIFSTDLPLNLAPLETRCIYAVFPIRHIRFQRFEIACRQRKHHRAGGHIQIRLDTARGRVNLRVRAAVDSPESLFEVLRANCR